MLSMSNIKSSRDGALCSSIQKSGELSWLPLLHLLSQLSCMHTIRACPWRFDTWSGMLMFWNFQHCCSKLQSLGFQTELSQCRLPDLQLDDGVALVCFCHSLSLIWNVAACSWLHLTLFSFIVSFYLLIYCVSWRSPLCRLIAMYTVYLEAWIVFVG